MKEYHTYIMMNEDNSVNYTGVTNDLFRRVWEHKSDYYPDSFTSRYNIYKIVYYENYYDINDAIAREKQIKGLSKQKKHNLVKRINPEYEDLSKGWYQNKNATNTFYDKSRAGD